MPEVAAAVIATLGVVLAAYLTYLGVRHTTRAAREANADTVSASEQETAVKALESMTLNLLQPYVEETDRLRKRIATMEQAREAEQDERERKAREIQDQITAQTERIDLLMVEVKHWKSMAKAIARWATVLRDEIIRLQGDVPSIPDELLMVQMLDERDEERRR